MALDLEPIDNNTLDLEPVEDTAGLDLEPVKTGPAEGYKITDAEVEDIAARFKMDPQKLKGLAPYYGGSVEPKEGSKERSTDELTKRTIGEISENTLLNLPQFAYKKLALNKNEQEAIDEVVSRIKDRETLADLGIDVAAGLPSMVLGYGAAAKAPLAAKLATTSAIGAAQGVATSKTGEEVKGGVIGGGIGLATGMIFEAGGKLLSKKAQQAVTEQVEEGGAKLHAKIRDYRAPTRSLDGEVSEAITSKSSAVPQFTDNIDKVPKALKTDLLEQGMDESAIVDQFNKLKLEQEKKDFVSYLSKSEGRAIGTVSTEEANDLLKERIATEGKPFIQKQYDNWKDIEAARNLMVEDMDNLHAAKGKFLERITFRLSDNRPIAGIIDKRNGTNLQVVLDDLSQKHKTYTTEMLTTLPAKNALKKEMSKESGERIVTAMRNDSLHGLSEKETELANRLKDIYEERRIRANELGIPIEHLKGKTYYVPDQIMEPADTIVAMKNKVLGLNKELKVNLLNLSPEEFEQIIRHPEIAELQQAMRVITHIEDVSTPHKFAAALKASMHPGKSSELMDMAASAAFERTGAIPTFLKENDPIKLLSNWERDTFRTAYYREGIEDLKKLRQQYIATGDANAADMLHNSILDLTGRKRGTLADSVQEQLLKVSVQAKEKIAAGQDTTFNRFLADAPNAMVSITNNVYPNFLGWNPRTAMTNLSQPIQMVLPELGPRYGSKLIGQAYLKALKTIGRGEEITLSEQMAKVLGKNPGDKLITKDLKTILQNNGVIGDNWNTELTRIMKSKAFSDATVGDKVLELAGKASHAANEIGMTLFDKAESINRYTTDIIGRQVARDFVKRNPEAIKYFNKGMAAGYKDEIQQAMKRQDFQRVEDLFSQHLLAKTQFNYDRITMSEAGRWLGPGLSAFIKWPTAIAGDIAASYATKNKAGFASDIGRRYMAPLAALSLAEHLIVSTEDKNSDRYKYFFGHEGMTKGAPINVVKDIIKGETGKPPIVSTATDLALGAIDAVSGDTDKLWKWTNNTIFSYVPQAGFINFLTTGVPTATEGKTPKGTFIGKAQEAVTGENTIDEFFKKSKE